MKHGKLETHVGLNYPLNLQDQFLLANNHALWSCVKTESVTRISTYLPNYSPPIRVDPYASIRLPVSGRVGRYSLRLWRVIKGMDAQGFIFFFFKSPTNHRTNHFYIHAMTLGYLSASHACSLVALCVLCFHFEAWTCMYRVHTYVSIYIQYHLTHCTAPEMRS